jgi:SAM-dependent methyltransferase
MDYHDILAYEGVGSAHPGGYAATIDFLSHFPIEKGKKVLEIGCGTGRTACYLATQGCEVTAVDIQPKMFETVRGRAKKERLSVRWIEGDACSLPFSDEHFDVVLAESVTVFTHTKQALNEYYRVLKNKGTVFDREFMAIKACPEEMMRDLREFYGVDTLPSLKEWLTHFRDAGFRDVEVWKPTALSDDIFYLLNGFNEESVGNENTNDASIEEVKQKNTQLLSKYEQYQGYGVFMGTK